MPSKPSTIAPAESTTGSPSVSLLPLDEAAPVRGSALGIFSSLWYFACGTTFLAAAIQLDTIANISVNLGTTQEDFVDNLWSVPVTTLVRVPATLLLELNVSGPFRHGSESLADLQYDRCNNHDNTSCTAEYEPNERKVVFLLGMALSLIPEFELPQYQTSHDFMAMFTNNFFGWNMPVMMYFFPDQEFYAVVCATRRATYSVASASDNVTNSFAFCSRRAYDPDWMCENNATSTTETYVIQIARGVATYLGRTPRSMIHFNPGQPATLTGAPAGPGILHAPAAIDEYNGGLLTAQAPWDILPYYDCKRFNPKTYTGWYYEGRGVVTVNWQSPPLMWSNALVLWSMTLFLLAVQYRFLRYSSVSIVPMHMAKEVTPYLCAGLAVYGNRHFQVLSTFLHQNAVSNISGPMYMCLGPMMMASIAAIMNSTIIQLIHNPNTVVSTRLMLCLSMFNWIVVFVFESVVVPRLSTGIASPCAMPTSTSCLKYEATDCTIFVSVLVTVVLSGAGALAVKVASRRCEKKTGGITPPHSLFTLFGRQHLFQLIAGDTSDCVRTNGKGMKVLDPAVMFNKNLVRVTDSQVLRMASLKYVMIYEMLPVILRRGFSGTIGPIITLEAIEDQVTQRTQYIELCEITAHKAKYVSAYLR